MLNPQQFGEPGNKHGYSEVETSEIAWRSSYSGGRQPPHQAIYPHYPNHKEFTLDHAAKIQANLHAGMN